MRQARKTPHVHSLAWSRGGHWLSCFRISAPNFGCVVAAAILAGGFALAAASARAGTLPATPPADRVALGRGIFEDPRLSEPPGTSCASCHDPATAYSSQNGSRNGL